MSDFPIYFNLGFRHLTDIYRVEYILFLFAISAIFLLKDWRRVFILVAFFTLGYSISYYFSSYGIVRFDRRLIDFLVSLTVFLTAFSNILRKKERFHIRGGVQRNFFLALVFGLVHGFGFSNYVSGIFNSTSPPFASLFFFQIGLEVGILLIIFFFLMIAFFFISIFGINRRDWVLVVSSGIAGVAITMMFESKYW
jgi:hypothetical protein